MFVQLFHLFACRLLFSQQHFEICGTILFHKIGGFIGFLRQNIKLSAQFSEFRGKNSYVVVFSFHGVLFSFDGCKALMRLGLSG